MITINLHNLVFHAFHGVHEEEKILGNTFIVNVSISFQPAENISKLDQSVNYATVFEIIKNRMAIPATLLEILAQDMAREIYSLDKKIKSISISVEKKNPPVPNMEGSVSVNYTKQF